MTKFAFLSTSLAAMLVALLPVTPAQAIPYTFVSSTGGGTACTFAAPCDNFQDAHDATDARGQIACLDSGFFSGGATITKSITIDCVGTSASTNAFSINTAGIVVTIRNLTMLGPAFGIDFQNGAALFVENCIIRDTTTGFLIGIRFRPSVSGSQLVVTDTVIKSNGSGTTGGGIVVRPASGVTTNVALNRVTLSKNSHGIVADGNGGGSIHGMARDSVVAGNVNNGITVTSSGAGSAVLSVENTNVSGNNFGLVAGGASSGMLVSQSSIVLNNTGLFTTGGALLLSYKNNNVNATTDGAFTGVIGQQ